MNDKTQEAFLGPWPARTLESGLSIVTLNRKSELQGPGRPGSQKCLLGMDNKNNTMFLITYRRRKKN